jgi:hypothetical protein
MVTKTNPCHIFPGDACFRMTWRLWLDADAHVSLGSFESSTPVLLIRESALEIIAEGVHLFGLQQLEMLSVGSVTMICFEEGRRSRSDKSQVPPGAAQEYACSDRTHPIGIQSTMPILRDQLEI